MKVLVLLIGLSASLRSEPAMGFANGVKIGEVTPTSAVIWTRLTHDMEAGNRVDEWNAESPNWTVPGQEGEIQLIYWEGNVYSKDNALTAMAEFGNDSCVQFLVEGLRPATQYSFQLGCTKGSLLKSPAVFEYGKFTTAPSADSEKPLTFTVSTCQEFELRDDMANGHKIYDSMRRIKPAFFVQTGDTLYYERKEPLSKNMTLARYRWGRMYALPYQKAFHEEVPSYWMHDDHDLLKNDCWAGQKFGDLTWEQGLQIWREQIPQSDKPYRTFRWGKNLQIWLPEGREFRSPNNMPDGPGKSILGEEQWAWLEKTMGESDATFKLYLSATPVVGPDRGGKNDNHANEGFHYEGERLRKFLNTIPGCFVINGDRHWQYHSVDPETGLNEFGCGPASDAHAQGWNPKDKRPEHKFLRVKGGFASIAIDGKKATFKHHDVDGEVTYSTEINFGDK